MNLILITVLLGSFTITSYRSVPSQTDNSPFITSTGETVCKDGVAASQDLIRNGIVHYGDWIFIEDIGLKRVTDTMNKRHTNRFDVWVATLEEEKKFHSKFKNKKLRIWLIRPVKT